MVNNLTIFTSTATQVGVVTLSVCLFLAIVIYPIGYIVAFFILRPLCEPLSTYNVIAGFPLTGLISGLNIVCCIILFFERKMENLLIPNIMPIMFLIFIGSLSFYNSPVLSISISHSLRLISWFALGILVYNCVFNSKDIIKVLASISFSSIIPMIIAYIHFFVHSRGDQIAEGIFRIQSIFQTVDSWAVFLSLVLFATSMLYLKAKETGMRFLYRICIPIGLSQIFLLGLSYHRGSWISLSVAAIFMTLIIRKIRLVIAFICLAGFIVLIFHNEIILRFNDLFVERQYGFNSLEARLILWRAIFSMLPNHLLVGHGLGCAREILANADSQLKIVPHNDYLRVLLETGLIGFILYLWFLGGEIIQLIKAFRYSNLSLKCGVMFGCVIYFLLISLTQNLIYDVVNMGIMFSILSIFKKEVYLEKVSYIGDENTKDEHLFNL